MAVRRVEPVRRLRCDCGGTLIVKRSGELYTGTCDTCHKHTLGGNPWLRTDDFD
jgi:hypothetical protein